MKGGSTTRILLDCILGPVTLDHVQRNFNAESGAAAAQEFRVLEKHPTLDALEQALGAGATPQGPPEQDVDAIGVCLQRLAVEGFSDLCDRVYSQGTCQAIGRVISVSGKALASG
jgi:hypothetical protein